MDTDTINTVKAPYVTMEDTSDISKEGAKETKDKPNVPAEDTTDTWTKVRGLVVWREFDCLHLNHSITSRRGS